MKAASENGCSTSQSLPAAGVIPPSAKGSVARQAFSGAVPASAKGPHGFFQQRQPGDDAQGPAVPPSLQHSKMSLAPGTRNAPLPRDLMMDIKSMGRAGSSLSQGLPRAI